MATLSSERYVLLNRLADEFAERYRRGERPSLQEYVDRHPDLADDIREYFPALVEVERVKENRREVQEPPRAVPAPPLERLGDYRILREIGRGGMGVVYEAEQVSLGRHVALKVLPSQHRQDTRTGSRFEREAKAAAKLHHTNIVPVFGDGEHDGLRYYVMQFIQGLGLDVILEELKRLQPGPGRPVGVPRMTGGEPRAALGDVSRTGLARSLLTGGFVMAAERQGDAPASASAATVDHTPVAPGEEAPPGAHAGRRAGPRQGLALLIVQDAPGCGGGPTSGEAAADVLAERGARRPPGGGGPRARPPAGRPPSGRQAVELAARQRRHRLGHRLRPGQGRGPAEPDGHRRHPGHAALHATRGLRRPGRPPGRHLFPRPDPLRAAGDAAGVR